MRLRVVEMWLEVALTMAALTFAALACFPSRSPFYSLLFSTSSIHTYYNYGYTHLEHPVADALRMSDVLEEVHLVRG